MGGIVSGCVNHDHGHGNRNAGRRQGGHAGIFNGRAVRSILGHHERADHYANTRRDDVFRNAGLHVVRQSVVGSSVGFFLWCIHNTRCNGTVDVQTHLAHPCDFDCVRRVPGVCDDGHKGKAKQRQRSAGVERELHIVLALWGDGDPGRVQGGNC